MTSTQTRGDRIREVFTRLATREGSGVDTHTLAEVCIKDGIFTEDELKKAALDSAANKCKTAIKKKGEDGIPFALPYQAYEQDEDGSTVMTETWVLARFWDAPLVAENVRRRLKLAADTKAEGMRLLQLGRLRWPDHPWDEEFDEKYPDGYKP